MDDSFLPLVKVDALTVEREGHIVLGHINLILEGGGGVKWWKQRVVSGKLLVG